MTTSSGVAKNTLFNFGGQAIVLIVAFFSIPLMIKGMGTERFGVLALVWSFIGYFSLFDLGLGRALTSLVARSLNHERHTIPPLIWTGFALLVLLGIVGALAILATAPWFVHGVLKIPPELQGESLTALYLMAAIFPFVISHAGFRGILEGLQRFDIVNGINATYGIFSFAGSLLVLQFSSHLGALTFLVIIGRLASWIVALSFCLKLIPDLRNLRIPEAAAARRLLTFGGWLTVTNIVGPLMVYLDRFLIGAWLSVAAVAYYTTPYDVVTKLWIIPSALVGVLFPVFSSYQASNPENTTKLFNLGVKYIYITLFPLILLIVAFAREGLTFWLNPVFAAQSTGVLQWLAAGVLVNSLALVPFVLIQGAGRPDLTAKLHLLELPIYLMCVSMLIPHFGIMGAAIAWTLRVAIDTILLFFLAGLLFLQKNAFSIAFISIVTASLIGLLFVASIEQGIIKIWACIIVLAVFVMVSLFFLFTAEERLNITGWLNKFRGQLGKKRAQ